jgi:hypothetical protein
MKWVLKILLVIGVLGMTLSTLAQESKDVPRVYTAEQRVRALLGLSRKGIGRAKRRSG